MGQDPYPRLPPKTLLCSTDAHLFLSLWVHSTLYVYGWVVIERMVHLQDAYVVAFLFFVHVSTCMSPGTGKEPTIAMQVLTRARKK